MRRLLLGLTIGGLLLMPTGAALAQTPGPTGTTGPTDPAKFALTPWDFPSPAVIQTSQVETNALAEADDVIFHWSPTSFTNEGRTTGYYMDVGQGNMDKSGKDHPVFTHYLVSMYPTVDAAAAAFTAERTGWETVLTDPTSPVPGQVVDLGGQQFGDQMGKGLYSATFQSDGGPLNAADVVFQRGTYVIEVWQTFLQADASYGTAAQPFIYSLAKELDTLAGGGTLAARPTPAVDFSIQSVRFEKNKASHALGTAPLKQANAGAQVQMGIYIVVRSAPPGAKLSDQYTLTSGPRSLHKKYTHTMGSYPPDYYHLALYNVLLPRAGTYKFKGQITIGGMTKGGSATLKVTGKTVKLVRFTRTSGHGDVQTLPPGRELSPRS